MPEPAESEEKVTSVHDTPIGTVNKSRFDMHGEFFRYAHILLDATTKETEQIARRQDALDSALLNGTISDESAKEEKQRLREDREQVNSKMHEAMRFIAQMNRDVEATVTLDVNRRIERGKLDYDFNKHFTTLGTGSVLFIAALSRVIFPDVSETEGLPLLFVSLALLILSVVGSAAAMQGAIVDMANGSPSPSTWRVAISSWSFFSGGMTMFIMYLGVNLSSLSFESNRFGLLLLIFASACLVLSPIIGAGVSNVVEKIRGRRNREG